MDACYFINIFSVFFLEKEMTPFFIETVHELI